jgi:predicted RNA-binding protein
MDENNVSQSKKYLIILPCSKRKKPISKAPAIELYDGPFYRVLRKNMPNNLDILILSAKYGLIRQNDTISNYDQKMTIERAKELANEIEIKLINALKNNNYKEVFVNLGKTYMLALERGKRVLNKQNVYWATGEIGERLHQLKNWLNKINREVEVIY